MAPDWAPDERPAPANLGRGRLTAKWQASGRQPLRSKGQTRAHSIREEPCVES
jgi:hypothetical protein